MSQSNKTPVSRLVGAVATGTLVAGSLFSMQAMAGGYMQQAQTDDKTADAKAAEGKCGEGKCGGEHASAKGGGASVGKANPGKRQHKPHAMADMDTDKDGRMSRAEFNAAHQDKTMAHDDWLEQSARKFAAHDANGDGFITQAEMDAHHKAAEGKCGEGKCGEGKCGGSN